jgi:SpoIID/LytB domain protein
MKRDNETNEKRRNKRKSYDFSFVSLFFVCFVFPLCSSCATYEGRVAPAIAEIEADEVIQESATRALGDREGTVIVINPQDGRIRALVNPRLAFEQAYPPGSAIKPFTTLAAMQTGLINRESRRLCRTNYRSADFEIACSHPKSKSPFDPVEALAYSCNYYFAYIGERLSEGAFNATLDIFGFGSRTGAGVNESTGSLPKGEWDVRAALGESDRLLVTPIQMIMAYSALVNGGRLLQPQQGSDQNVIPREKARLSISPQHRAWLIEGMRGAVKFGTAEKANLGDSSAYIFGKTGTSTSSNRFRTQGWFVGFATDREATGTPPAGQIKLGVLVFLKRSRGSECAEVAKIIFDKVLKNDQSEILPQQAGTSDRPSIKIHSVSENVTRELPLEDYLIGVLSAEASIENELEALKAQAIVSRTYALSNRGRHTGSGYDYCSTTHCQRFVFSPGQKRSAARRAIEATAGVVMLDNAAQLIDAYFHAACGGWTANIESLWGIKPGPPYLRGVRDDYCKAMPHRRWTTAIPANEIVRAMRSDQRTDAGERLNRIIVSKRDSTGRAAEITLEGERRAVVRGWDFKIIAGRSLGWQMIKSSRFEVTRAGNEFIFRGSGFGHGLGLCQEGSHVMASRGMDHRLILDYYFPGVRLNTSHRKIVPASGLPEESRGSESIGRRSLSSEHFHIDYPAGIDRSRIEKVARILEAAHLDLMRRLKSASLRSPESSPYKIVIHETTADFIAATGQPGWVAGATRGMLIELQPMSLLERRGILHKTLRHELTHALIELLGKGRAPRWLAEGLAIHVAGEGAIYSRIAINNQLSREELERRLSKPVSANVMKDLYSRSYREVRAIIEAGGEARAWQQVAKHTQT